MHLEGPASVDGSVEDHSDGTYTASYRACKAGPYTLSVTNGTTPCLLTSAACLSLTDASCRAFPLQSLAQSAFVDADHLRVRCRKNQMKQQTERRSMRTSCFLCWHGSALSH